MNIPEKNCKYFVFYNQDLLLIKQGNAYELPDIYDEIVLKKSEPLLLGYHHGYACYTVETLFSVDQCSQNSYFIPLKYALEYIGTHWFGIASKAYQILLWNKNHNFCGRCGKETEFLKKSFERRCHICSLSFFPRISPSIIVMIHKDNKILMARSAHFPPGVFALIAGFVEPGETLEEAVHREVKEEVGIAVKNIRYVDSQTWPFPDSLMIAFIADYASGEIILVDGEIEEAGWYDACSLPGLPSSKISVARKLIDQFIKSRAKEY